MHPPAKTTQHQIERMARSLEQTMARRRRLLRELRDLDQHIRTTRKLLRDVIAEATAPVDIEIIPGQAGGQRDDLASERANRDPKTRPPKPRRTPKGSRSQKR